MQIQITEREKNILTDERDFVFNNEPYCIEIQKNRDGHIRTFDLIFDTREEKEYFQFRVSNWK